MKSRDSEDIALKRVVSLESLFVCFQIRLTTAKTQVEATEIINLREERQSILTEAALKHDLQERMEDLIAFLDEQTEAVTEYSEPLARRLIEKITVYDEKLVVEFKSGLTVEVEA